MKNVILSVKQDLGPSQGYMWLEQLTDLSVRLGLCILRRYLMMSYWVATDRVKVHAVFGITYPEKV